MKRFLAIIVALTMLLMPAALAEHTITVQGTGVVRTTPDVAVINLGAEAYGQDVATIQQQVNSAVNAIIDALTGEQDIPQDNIQTGNYSIYRRYYDDYGNPSREYVASCMLNITVNDVDRAGEVIDAAFAAGANSMGYVSFGVADQSELADEALTLAVQNAIHRAQIIAAAAGVELPSAPSVITEGIDTGVNTRTYAMTSGAASDSTASKIMAGSVEITATVTVTYTVED